MLALGFGARPPRPGTARVASLHDGFDDACDDYVAELAATGRHALCRSTAAGARRGRNLYRVSTAVLRTHEVEVASRAASIASLSIPWGFNKGDDDLGGYHLVWPRDLVETRRRPAGRRRARATRAACCATCRRPRRRTATGRRTCGSTARPTGTASRWTRRALPILLVDLAPPRRARCRPASSPLLADGAQRAAGYIVPQRPGRPSRTAGRRTPATRPSRSAAEIAALLAAAEMADAPARRRSAAYLRETADAWNDQHRALDLRHRTPTWRAQVGVDGYYVRIAPPDDRRRRRRRTTGFVPIKNRPPGESERPGDADRQPRRAGPGPLRPARAPTTRASSTRSRSSTRCSRSRRRPGPVWHRYNDDGYGEHEDGAPFDGTGIGRAWPLLTGERAHYELAAGRRDEAARLLERDGGLRQRRAGCCPSRSGTRPTSRSASCSTAARRGSAMPLVWAHAEYVKLLRSLRDGRVFDTAAADRAALPRRQAPPRRRVVWRFNHKLRAHAARRAACASRRWRRRVVHWSADGWRTVTDAEACDTGLGVWVADLPTAELAGGRHGPVHVPLGGGPLGGAGLRCGGGTGGLTRAPRPPLSASD